MGRLAPDNSDVRFAIDQFAKWIANADAKASALGAALAVLAAAVGAEGRTLLRHLPPTTAGEWASAAGLSVSSAALVLSIALVVRAVTPVLTVPRRHSRYSWSVIDAPLADLVRTDHVGDREQAWLMARLLASIARRKYRNLRQAFVLWAFACLAFLAVAVGNLGR